MSATQNRGGATGLVQYVVYDHPADFPEQVVVRRWRILPATLSEASSIRADAQFWLYTSVEAAREPLRDQGLVCLARDPNDDPAIVETWL